MSCPIGGSWLSSSQLGGRIFQKLRSIPMLEQFYQALKEKGLKMGVVTNGLQSDVAQILPKIGLPNFFNVVVVINT